MRCACGRVYLNRRRTRCVECAARKSNALRRGWTWEIKTAKPRVAPKDQQWADILAAVKRRKAA